MNRHYTARDIAESYFDADRVLTNILARVRHA